MKARGFTPHKLGANENVADIGAKGLELKKFAGFRDMLGLTVGNISLCAELSS